MNSLTKETRSRGTLLFPFQHYDMHPNNGHLFVTSHWHEEIEIIYVLEGAMNLHLNHQSYCLKKGDIFFINSSMLHQMESTDTSLHYYAYVFPLTSLSFQIEDYIQTFYLQPLMDGTLLFPTSLPSNPHYDTIRHELLSLIEIDSLRPQGYQLLSKGILYKIIGYLFQEDLFLSSSSIASSNAIEKSILLYIEQNYTAQIYLSDIAKQFSMSPNYFCKYFKSRFGKSFVSYLNYYRIEKACVLLLSTSQSILEIALQTGFDNISYFNKCFKSIIGITPSNYRKS